MIGGEDNVFILDFGIGCLLAETEGESLVDTMSTAQCRRPGSRLLEPDTIMDPTNLRPRATNAASVACSCYMLTSQYPFPDGRSLPKR
ncbi:MAG: hypothetical protein U0744_16290 [Gemmataceae bacterium]